MSEQGLKGLARLIAAFGNSAAGFRDAWRSDEAFRIEFMIFLASIPGAFWLGDDPGTIVLLIASVLFVVVVEVLNSAIEAVVDRIGPERHELSRMAKDLGSLAVLLSAFVPGLIWLAALWQKLSG